VSAAGYENLRLETTGAVARVRLNRPTARNAFDDVLIDELTRAFGSAGADVAWMRKAGGYSRGEI
jgi:enoyl-CoA hydratase/carnithine racemase